jgi:uncharacterized protein (TIRG00374 family)
VGGPGRGPLSGPGIPGIPPEVAAEVAPPSRARRILGLLFRACGLALLAAVLWQVPWRDRVHLADGTVIRGRLGPAAADGAARILPADGGAERVVPADGLARRDRGLPAAEEGVLTLARRLRPLPTLAVMAYILGSAVVAALRWRMLLRTQGIPVSAGEATALTFLGNFFNQVLPGGLVGGDVLKALYAARGRERAPHAVVSVFVDRVLGLFGTVILACVALLPRWSDPAFHGHAVVAYGILVAGVLAGGAVLSRRVRALLRMEEWMPRVPFVGSFLAEVDRAVLAFRERKSVVVAGLGISVAIHAGWCGANFLLGRMLGVDLPLAAWFAVIPPILIVSAIPLLPGGWGVGELSFVFFLGLVGVPAAPALAISLLGRSLQILGALPGGIVFLARRAG